MLAQLLWKDIQNQKGMLLLGLFFLLGPYCFYVFGDRSPFLLANCANFSLVASMLTVVVMGATVIGLERQNRGLEFLLGLPVSRSKILLSKVLISLVVASAIWGVYYFVTEVCLESKWQSETRPFALGTLFVGFLIFTVAWLTSIVTRGTAISIGAAMGVATLILIAVMKYASQQDWEIQDYGQNVLNILNPICLGGGAVSFIVGWMKFTKRCEP